MPALPPDITRWFRPACVVVNIFEGDLPRALVRGHDSMVEPLSGLVLAGGESTRFGSDKAAALIAGRPMLQWVVDALGSRCSEIVVAAAPGQRLPNVATAVPLRVVRDQHSGGGPLAGLIAGLSTITSPLCFVASCDMPLLRPPVITLLRSNADDHDLVCAEIRGRLQPLGSVFRAPTCLPVLRAAIAARTLKLTAAFAGLDIAVVHEDAFRSVDPELESFMNVNLVDDLRSLAAIVEARRRSACETP